MTFRKALVLIAILVALAVTALLLREPLSTVFDAGKSTPTPAAAVEKVTDRVSEGIAQGRMSDYTARYWDAVGEKK